jgi:hypothetical protein
MSTLLKSFNHIAGRLSRRIADPRPTGHEWASFFCTRLCFRVLSLSQLQSIQWDVSVVAASSVEDAAPQGMYIYRSPFVFLTVCI